MRSLYVTTAKPSEGSGGGVVALHEIKALNPTVTIVMNEQQPFLNDYFCLWKIIDDLPYGLAHFYGTPFGLTAERLKLKGTKISCTVPAHNLERSVEEHIKLYGSYPYTHMTDPYLWSLYSHHIKIADLVICPSKMSANYIKWKLQLEKDPTIIRHGCNIPAKPASQPETFTVGHLGVNGPDKGQIYLMQAWNIASLYQAKLFLAGAGTEHFGGAGYIPSERVFHDSISVYVQPSVTEGYGIPVLDAMANAHPVIVSEGAGVHEIVEDGKDGFVVPIRNPKIIAEKIRYYFDNPSEIQRCGKNAREKALNYSWDKIEKEYEKLFVGMLK